MASLSIALALLLASCCAELSDLDMAEAVHRRMSSYADGGSDAKDAHLVMAASVERTPSPAGLGAASAAASVGGMFGRRG